MSRPYLNVTNVTYSNPVLSVTFEALRLRGGGTISVTGFSQSLVLSTTHSFAWDNASTKGGGIADPIVATFSVASNIVVGTHSVGLYFAKLGGFDTETYTFNYSIPVTTTTTTAAPATTTTTTATPATTTTTTT